MAGGESVNVRMLAIEYAPVYLGLREIAASGERVGGKSPPPMVDFTLVPPVHAPMVTPQKRASSA